MVPKTNKDKIKTKQPHGKIQSSSEDTTANCFAQVRNRSPSPESEIKKKKLPINEPK